MTEGDFEHTVSMCVIVHSRNVFREISRQQHGETVMTERRPTPTVRRRQLGTELRQLREGAGLTGDEATERLGWYGAKVSRIENGRISVPWSDVSDLLDLYGVEDRATREALIRLAKEARQKDWWQPYSDLLSKEARTYIGLEAAAESLHIYQPCAVPGLLQSPDYARAIITRAGPLVLSETEVERRIKLRQERQATLSREGGLELWAVLDEAALRREIGGPVTMGDQMRHLVQAGCRREITIQVVPFKAGPHASMDGGLGIFTFAEPGENVAFVGTAAGTLFLGRQADVRAASLAFEHLRAVALGPAASLDLVEAAAREYEQATERQR
ncbi:helix-turn-helix transcriptional regulator [Spirillospora sp. NPDC047279]|uniref:helix-turn-helix domain-containing protein n=1 Tax=Spirillospora sp. NPDC047279 TaxID=3155478 RepID=UPI0033C65D33